MCASIHKDAHGPGKSSQEVGGGHQEGVEWGRGGQYRVAKGVGVLGPREVGSVAPLCTICSPPFWTCSMCMDQQRHVPAIELV